MTEPTHHDVISAFIDNEPFEARALAEALADPQGREALLDLIALRHVVGEDTAAIEAAAQRPASRWRSLVAAAAIVVGLVGAYSVGRNVAPTSGEQALEEAPPPDRVIELRPGMEWKPLNGGR